jgi:hypothetical protein
MNNLTTRVILLLFPFSLLLVGCQREDTAPVIAQHEKKYPDIRKKYVYQSLIRLANVNHDPDFEKLIKDVKKVILYLPPSEDSTYQIKDLLTGMRSGGYEELVDVRTADAQRISLWVRENGSKQHYLALVDSEAEDLILEIDGQIHLEYLNSIRMTDESALMDLLKGGF